MLTKHYRHICLIFQIFYPVLSIHQKRVIQFRLLRFFLSVTLGNSLDALTMPPVTKTNGSVAEMEEERTLKFKAAGIGQEIEYRLAKDVPYSIKGDKAIKANNITSFSDPALGLDPHLVENIAGVGYVKPTPIQRRGMPQLLAKLDLMCCSHTGTGKTATYLLPMINMILQDKRDAKKVGTSTETEAGLETEVESATDDSKKTEVVISKKGNVMSAPTGLVLVPTRELAEQIAEDGKRFAVDLKLNCMPVFGGDALSKELSMLRRGDVDIVIATPGRLIHLLDVNEFDHLTLERVKYLVIDEADEMFDRGFFHSINEIIQFMPSKEKRVTAMFSATFKRGIQFYARKHLRSDHVFLVIGILGAPSPDIIQEISSVSAQEKMTKLEKEIKKNQEEKFLVFCNTIEMVDLVRVYLHESGLFPSAIHSELSQYERDQALNDFNVGKKKILVATSVASRGLNIQGPLTVINYDFPRTIEDYVQRIGRSRGDPVKRKKVDVKFGKAISFFDVENDDKIVGELCLALKSVNQPMPEFLNKVVRDIQEIQESPEYMFGGIDGQMNLKLHCKMPGKYEYRDVEKGGLDDF